MNIKTLILMLIAARFLSTGVYAVPADEIDWGWSTPPTFPNEAFGPRIDVNPNLIGDNHLFDV